MLGFVHYSNFTLVNFSMFTFSIHSSHRLASTCALEIVQTKFLLGFQVSLSNNFLGLMAVVSRPIFQGEDNLLQNNFINQQLLLFRSDRLK